MCKKAASSLGNAAAGLVGGVAGATIAPIYKALTGSGRNTDIPGVPSPQYLPQVDPLTPEELGLIQKQGLTLDQINNLLSTDVAGRSDAQNALRQFTGLYGADGKLDQEAVNTLRQRIFATQNQGNQLNDLGVGQLMGSFQPSQLETSSDQIGLLEAQQLSDALQGRIAPSVGLVQSEQDEFDRLKESAGQRGIRLEGDDLYSATSESTAGNQLIANLRKNSALRRDQERNAIIQRGTEANLNRLGFGLNRQGQTFNQAASLRNNPYADAVGLLNTSQEYAPAELASQYGTLAQGYGSLRSPYENTRLKNYEVAQYNNQLNNANLTQNYQRDLTNLENRRAARRQRSGLLGTIGGGLLGFGISGGNPYGGMIGAQLGQNIGQTFY